MLTADMLWLFSVLEAWLPASALTGYGVASPLVTPKLRMQRRQSHPKTKPAQQLELDFKPADR